MLIRRPPDIPTGEITDEALYWNRREWLRAAGLGVIALTGIPTLAACQRPGDEIGVALDGQDTPNTWEQITGYNNFYEFGTGKEDPARYGHTLKPAPWTISVEGEVMAPRTYGVEDLFRGLAREERVYRMRCVEAWSMVVPWNGYPLGKVIERLQPTSHARFVEFTTLYDPEQMPGQRRSVLDWPYVEGLRMDEAMHPLSLLVTGIYGRTLPNQNGAPVRLIVPWKYGFKGGKSIVRIRFLREQPRNSWNIAAPNEYGFYANVNPEVDHPRWSQATERRIGKLFRQPTLLFNGYADQVAQLYRGMDLRRNF